jgi:ribonucrease Y
MWLPALLGAVAVAVGGGSLACWLALRASRRDAEGRLAAARAEAAATALAAERDASATRHTHETEARERALEVRTAAEREAGARLESLARREERAAKREAALEADTAETRARIEALRAREAEVGTRTEAARSLKAEAAELETQIRLAVETAAGATTEMVRSQLAESWIEEAKAQAAQLVRQSDQNPSDPEWARQAKRVMGIAIHRYQGHYLTERLLSNIALPPGVAEELSSGGGTLLRGIEEGSGVKLELAETGEKVRIDSGDGVAREIARRALHKIIKGTAPRGFDKDPRKWVEHIAAHLDREIVDLGKKAFVELEIPRAHPDIVKLVGRLNYRTSYTQNQWKHAIEAAFIGGMMAAELGLDVKVTRRATLMHDIGKSLTHEIEGSHAVIGADYARRLGESEIVANAIGAHHADEPPSSVYAFLVAAADAMSGARPGARREQTESYSNRLEDLERIGHSFRGVSAAVAVQGGREVRVYVKEREVDDLRAVELSTEIARKISDEMVFPGQIKVTVIRTVEAVETAN